VAFFFKIYNMKKLFTFIILCFSLISCNETIKEKKPKNQWNYTTDKEEAIELKKEQSEDLKSYYEDALKIDTDFAANEKEILADYGGEEDALIEKAKTKNEKALDALAELRNLQMNRWKSLTELDRKIRVFNNALSLSISDIKRINEAKDLKRWMKNIDAEDKIQDDLKQTYYKAVEKLDID